jgi:hypothetical protein
MQAHGAQREPAFAEVAPDRISRPGRNTAANVSLALLVAGK